MLTVQPGGLPGGQGLYRLRVYPNYPVFLGRRRLHLSERLFIAADRLFPAYRFRLFLVLLILSLAALFGLYFVLRRLRFLLCLLRSMGLPALHSFLRILFCFFQCLGRYLFFSPSARGFSTGGACSSCCSCPPASGPEASGASPWPWSSGPAAS